MTLYQWLGQHDYIYLIFKLCALIGFLSLVICAGFLIGAFVSVVGGGENG
jgi:hypothetical protein